ncbi:MAG: toast rack family protein [Chloroflexota bacterium]
MSRKPVFAAIVVLVLASLACKAPDSGNHLKTGPVETQEIYVQSPDDTDIVRVNLEFGAGELNIEPGAENALIDGLATYNVADLAPEVNVQGGLVSVSQGNLKNSPFWNFDGDLKNNWTLRLGSTPIRLEITAGAYDGNYELGGLAIERLLVQDGAADVELSFDEPNLTEMSLLRYQTGASQVELRGLANANFEEMAFQGGAGDYTLDFSGELLRDAEVRIDAGISAVRILVPEGVNVVLRFDGGLSSVDVNGAWEQTGGRYIQSGSGPTLTIQVDMGAGSLELDNP